MGNPPSAATHDTFVEAERLKHMMQVLDIFALVPERMDSPGDWHIVLRGYQGGGEPGAYDRQVGAAGLQEVRRVKM